MILKTHFRLTDTRLDDLKHHLFPGDGLEASAIVLASCNKIKDQIIFLVQDILLVPHSECKRTVDYLTWPGKYIEEAIEKGEENNLSIFLMHSHPSGFNHFSTADDESDQRVIPCIFAAYNQLHGSIIVTPDGKLTGRFYDKNLSHQYIDKFLIVGQDIALITPQSSSKVMPFSADMTESLKNFKVGVIGASGTGSIVIENLARLGVGHLVLIDDDVIEYKNLNRILNSTIQDAENQKSKVKVLADVINQYRSDVVLTALDSKIGTQQAILEVATCDVLFSCVDTVSARMYVDLVGEYFLLPVFDIGVTIPTGSKDGKPFITEVCARLDYIQPHRSSLKDRKVYTPDSLRAEYLKETSPDIYEKQLKEGYFKGVHEEAPSVISLNMLAASFCINEFIARTFLFRQENNSNYARTVICLGANETEYLREDNFTSTSRVNVGKGITTPLLGMPNL
ncbi:ThiF family adenylyltransferase [Acinetobacter johnsonii]|uniref:Thiamine biosynthesis protein ThiF n=1 Tax=Acinetobacter johnsonii TaxID=40214 RepID=A0AAV3WFA3_ACIJO|nr:ThiF family adenylyltransferase [Acinetobacter johnsonii]MDN5478282.1 ThiF family adenylyltransferase [Chryseobacterium sp.]MDN5624426.1 ThiF family adenylyltransferase [Acinetobacter sp.]WQE01456.1 ThiF family adenylyltransferase [Acinetobacter johnsonii]GEK44222.1 thiamine biosynthesis protein ThiF [Acinetobacter johnsonii]